MGKVIIIEGSDGSGKDKLIEKLLKDFGPLQLQLGPRAVKSSQEGPVDDLARWTIRDLQEWPLVETTRVYNRHPLISEFVYGPLLRGHEAPGMRQVRDVALATMYRDALVVWCSPPLAEVTRNVSNERDMPGVQENIRTIFKMYRDSQRSYLGKKVTYDYTTHGKGAFTYSSVKMSVMSHIRERNNNR